MSGRTEQEEMVSPFGIAGVMEPRTGRLAPSQNPGVIMVEWDGSEPKPARLLSGIDRRELAKKENIGREVLILFDGGNPNLPIVVGQLENLLEDLVSLEAEKPESEEREPVETVMDGKRVVFEAEKEIVLKCGEGSITIKREGKIIVKGTDIISRASGVNKIKGGSVELN